MNTNAKRVLGLVRRQRNLVRMVATAVMVFSSLNIEAQEALLPVVSVSASSHDGNIPANTLDGSLSTRWSAQGDGQWILYDLGGTKTITKVQIAWHEGSKRVSGFDIQTSDNKSNWRIVFSGASSGKTVNLESYEVLDTAGRYVLIVGHGNTKNDWNSLTEVRTYGTEPAPDNESGLSISSVTASAHDGNVPANTLDGDLSTRWSAQGDGQWICYDLGLCQVITSVDIAWHQGNLRVSRFDIQTSENATAWTDVYCGSSSGQTLALETYNVTDTRARFVRIVGHGNTKNNWNSITEAAICGVVTDITDPPPEPPPPPSTDLWPSDILDLANWKLTLPCDTSHAGSPDEILQPELDGFSDPGCFYVNDAGDGVVFRAQCGGATTSGSGYPRSELREMINQGTTKACWSTTSGTHTMEITQAITHLPDVKPHVVAGQIHDASDDVIVFRLEGQKLFIDENGDDGPVLTTLYELGDVFTVKFVARNEGVECYYNGTYVYRYPASKSGCYFKAGCYTQSNTSKGDAPTAYGEGVIYRLSVSHQP